MRTLADGTRVTDSALTQIVVRAAEGVEGVKVRRPRRHLEIDLAAGDVRVQLDLTVEHGLVLPEVARAVQERVSQALGTMLDVRVSSVDVNVEAVA